MAPGWRDRNEWMMRVTGPVNAWLVDKSGAEAGQTVLEVASATGELGFLVAARVGEGGREEISATLTYAFIQSLKHKTPWREGAVCRPEGHSGGPLPFSGRRSDSGEHGRPTARMGTIEPQAPVARPEPIGWSELGGTPNCLAYSRLNWLELS